MTHTKDEALKLALEALEKSTDNFFANIQHVKAITAIKQARSAPVQEPVYQIRHYGTNTVWHDVRISAYVVSPKENRRILYTTPPAQPVVQWQPIETAPKNVILLLYGAKRLEVCVGMHHSRDGWVTDTTSEWASMYTPTHWMPLPEAPEKGGAA